MSTVLFPGTLCDERIFGAISPGLPSPSALDLRPFDRATAAAEALLGAVPPRSLGVAFSLGAWVLLSMLSLDPGRFRGIVLLAGNAFPDDPAKAGDRRASVQDTGADGYSALGRAMWRDAVGSAAAPHARGAALVAQMAQACGAAVHARQVEMNIHRPDLRALVATTDVPILVVAGQDDPLCPAERYAQAASGTRGTLVTLPRIGHYVPLEAPNAALAAIEAHLPELLA